MEGMPSSVEGGLGPPSPQRARFPRTGIPPKTDEDHVQVFHPPEQRLAVGRGLYLTQPRWPSLEETVYPLTTLIAAKSSWGQTMMVWVDPSLAAAALVGVVIGLGLPSQLWSWFGRDILRAKGNPALGFPFSPSSQDEADFLNLAILRPTLGWLDKVDN